MIIGTFIPKFLIVDLKDFKVEKCKFYYKKIEINLFEISGVVINDNFCKLEVLDFSGTVEMYKKKSLNLEEGSCIFTVRPFLKKQKIEFYLEKYKKVFFEEEFAFVLEAKIIKKDDLYNKCR